jgi:hypothetical protein
MCDAIATSAIQLSLQFSLKRDQMKINKYKSHFHYLAKIRWARTSPVTIFVHQLYSLGIHCFEQILQKRKTIRDIKQNI